MSLIKYKGNPSSPVWVIVDKPLSGDEDKGYLFSSPKGFVFDKMMREVGLSDYFVICRRPNTENIFAGGSWESELNFYKPKFIIPLDAAGKWLCPEMKAEPKKKGQEAHIDSSRIESFAGSLLTSDKISWPHYIVPTHGPDYIIRQWKMRDIVMNCDLAKIKDELDYYNTHGVLQPPATVIAKVDWDNNFPELEATIEAMMDSEWVSDDIESVYPRAPTKTLTSTFYKKLPGYPIVIGLTDKIDTGISFKMFRDSTVETRHLWQLINKLHKRAKRVGQNYFNFDSFFYEMLGFEVNLPPARDTLHMHHLLWPELPHKLQFLARQYTRFPYWKDEGAGWSMKNIRNMMVYNVKDVCGTLDIFFKMLAEIKERGLE